MTITAEQAPAEQTPAPIRRSRKWLARLEEYVFLTEVCAMSATAAAGRLGVSERILGEMQAHLAAHPGFAAGALSGAYDELAPAVPAGGAA